MRVLLFTTTVCSAIFVLSGTNATAQQLDGTSTQWSPALQWQVSNPTYIDNPFDLVATATFAHASSGEVRTTEMFYVGGDTWAVRFTATRTGTWTAVTTSTDPELDGLTGTITINPNPDLSTYGFVTSVGNKFARQRGDNGDLEAFPFNVFQSQAYAVGPTTIDASSDVDGDVAHAIALIKEHGCTAGYSGSIGNRWFDIGAMAWDAHTSEDPDLRTFTALEAVILRFHDAGLHLHIWSWGDESRRWTPIGVGGINGIPDRRLQRYIAARLGPLPGWTMGYGFDLQEWVTEDQIGAWAAYLHDHFGWQHMVWGRGRTHAELDAVAYSGFSDYGNSAARTRVESDTLRPHLFSERFIYLRRPYWDMTGTRRKIWQYTMAGGMGSWWGWWSSESPSSYPNPEQMHTHYVFMDHERRFSADLSPVDGIGTNMCLASPDRRRYVCYAEQIDSMTLDLTGMDSEQPAVAVDTTQAYAPIDLGTVTPGSQTLQLPTQSDWAVAIGSFATVDSLAPAAPSSLSVQ